MKLTNKLVERFGADKLLHCFLGGWFVSEFDFNIWCMTAALAVLAIMSFLKEYVLDDKEDFEDLLWGIVGGEIAFAFGVCKIILLS